MDRGTQALSALQQICRAGEPPIFLQSEVTQNCLKVFKLPLIFLHTHNFCKKHKGYIKLVSPYNTSDNKGAKFYKIKVKKVSKYINGVYSITATDGHHYKYSLMIGGEKNAKAPKKGQTLKVVLTNVHVKNMFEENDWGIADIAPASHVKR